MVTGAAKRIGRKWLCIWLKQGIRLLCIIITPSLRLCQRPRPFIKPECAVNFFAVIWRMKPKSLNLVPQVFKAFPNLNVLVNSASIFIPNQFGAGDLTLFKTHWDINFKAPYILTCEFARLVKKGQVINFVDANVVKYKTKYADYLMTKKALLEFTKMAAVQWGPRIRVNGISPGMILAPVNNQPDDRLKRARQIPLQRTGNPRNILQSVQFLLDNDYLTGQIIANDGGENLI